MKSTLLRTFFEWALITSVLMSVGFLAWYCAKSRQLSQQQRAATLQLSGLQANSQNNRALMGMLLAECQEYAKTNADMARFLSTGSSQPTAASIAPAPATKPKAK
jgi:hypothetical protein